MATSDTVGYRINAENKFASSEEEGELLSDHDNNFSATDLYAQNVIETESSVNTSTVTSTYQSAGQPVRRKRKNIWGDVLADQSSNDISNSVGLVGMKDYMSRGPESFSIHGIKKTDGLNSNNSVKRLKAQNLNKRRKNCSGTKGRCDSAKKKPSNSQIQTNNLKRKCKKKSKNNQVPQYQPGQRVTLNKRIEISDNDPEERVTEEIIFRLWERKKDLIRALVKIIGVPKTIFLYQKTEAVELLGGMMTLQGSRRRTPGGTFLHLLRNDEDIDQEAVKKILEAEFLREQEQRLLAKKAKKQPKEEHVLVGKTEETQSNACVETADISNSASLANELTEIEEAMDEV